MALSDFLFGKKHKEKTTQLPTMTGQQQDFLSQILSMLQGGQGGVGMGIGNLQQLLSGSPEAFAAFEAPAKRQFEQEIIPSLSERFSSLGQGAQQSSAFGQQLGQAGAGLSENLAAMRAALQQNAISQLMGLGQSALGQRPFENIYTPKSRSSGLFGSLAPGIGQGIGTGLGGGMGSLFSSLFY